MRGVLWAYKWCEHTSHCNSYRGKLAASYQLYTLRLRSVSSDSLLQQSDHVSVQYCTLQKDSTNSLPIHRNIPVSSVGKGSLSSSFLIRAEFFLPIHITVARLQFLYHGCWCWSPHFKIVSHASSTHSFRIVRRRSIYSCKVPVSRMFPLHAIRSV